MRLTREALITQARTRPFLDDPYGDRFDDDRVVGEINGVVLDLAERYRLCHDQVSVALNAGTYVYDLKGHIENIRDAGGSIRSFSGIERVTINGVDIVANGSVIEAVVIGGRVMWSVDFVSAGKVMIVPVAVETGVYGDDENNLQLFYTSYPEPMTADGDYPDTAIPPCDELLCLMASVRLFEEGDRADDFKKALSLADKAEKEMQRFNARLARGNGRVYDDMVPV